ncbi:phosphotransferase family protein [Alteromonas stellipolaris]|uniref:phosphotransferase family protein n=1 Tax=Alteromonas stellipolaris TaxID=233316 RepID=UPI001D365919|nr:aminoglycoside phosphotransferase family protein [Alteromonas stellipolaris]MBZ2163256.1 aminoglycoside phosphotransferase family protein [Alteromonas stellipolaris]
MNEFNDELSHKQIITLLKQHLSDSEGVEEAKINPQHGGLFNHIVRVNFGEQTWFVKQYLNKNVSAVFTPPEIDKTIRAELAYKVHRLTLDLAKEQGLSVLPADIYYDESASCLLIAGINQPIDLVEFFSNGLYPKRQLLDLAQLMANLHQYTCQTADYSESEFYSNEEFRDFKLDLQYDGIVDQLSEDVRQTVLEVAARYKDQQVCVLHGDLNSRNVIFTLEPNGISGVIDFEQSHVGHPVYELTYLLSEILISTCYYTESAAAAADSFVSFIERYEVTVQTEELAINDRDFIAHLAIQAIYRIIGPSRNSWSFYLDEQSKQKVIDLGENMLRNLEQADQMMAKVRSGEPLEQAFSAYLPVSELS